MLAQYFDQFAAHTKRAVAQGFTPLQFAQFVSLAKHLITANASESPK